MNVVELQKLFSQNASSDELLAAQSAVEWVLRNTTLTQSDIEPFSCCPASVKLFIKKFVEIYSLPSGVSSESIEGMSQSFSADDKAALVQSAASDLLSPYLTAGKLRFIPMTL